MSQEPRLKWLPSADGVLEGAIQWGGEEGLDPFLVHAISVPMAPLRLAEKAFDEAPLLRLSGIRFAVRSWRQLGDRTFSFPNVIRHITADGAVYPVHDIYGSLRLGAAYHQVQIHTLTFGPFDGKHVVVNLTGSAQSVDHPPLFAPTEFSCETALTVGAIAVRGDLGSNTVPTLSEAEALGKRLLQLEDYESPQLQGRLVVFRPRGGMT